MTSVINSSLIQTGLPQFPDNVPPELYNAFYAIHSAIENLRLGLSRYAGVDPQPSAYWSQLTLDDSIYAGNMNRWYVQAYENLAYGDCVSPILDTTTKVRKANATDATKIGVGFVNTVGTITAGEFCEVIVGTGLISSISGMIAGSRYYLSTTSGQLTNAAPATSGNIQQVMGIALASNRLLMNTNFDGRIVP